MGLGNLLACKLSLVLDFSTLSLFPAVLVMHEKLCKIKQNNEIRGSMNGDDNNGRYKLNCRGVEGDD